MKQPQKIAARIIVLCLVLYTIHLSGERLGKQAIHLRLVDAWHRVFPAEPQETRTAEFPLASDPFADPFRFADPNATDPFSGQ